MLIRMMYSKGRPRLCFTIAEGFIPVLLFHFISFSLYKFTTVYRSTFSCWLGVSEWSNIPVATVNVIVCFIQFQQFRSIPDKSVCIARITFTSDGCFGRKVLTLNADNITDSTFCTYIRRTVTCKFYFPNTFISLGTILIESSVILIRTNVDKEVPIFGSSEWPSFLTNCA